MEEERLQDKGLLVLKHNLFRIAFFPMRKGPYWSTTESMQSFDQ